MGYYVQITNSTAKVRADGLNKAYKAMCDLNKRDDLKTGGEYFGGKQTKRWFAWMPENYPEECKDAKAILDELGFWTSYDEEGNLLIEGYDSKTGSEDLFLDAIAPWTEGVIEWLGEDGEKWRETFASGTKGYQYGVTVWQ